MAEVIYQDPVQEIRGTLTKDGTIHRHKTYYRFDAFIRTCLLREMP